MLWNHISRCLGVVAGAILVISLAAGCGGGSKTEEKPDFGTLEDGAFPELPPVNDLANEDGNPDGVDTVPGDSLPDLGPDGTLPDIIDLVTEDNYVPVEGGLLWPCLAGAECDSGYCLSMVNKSVCTVKCDNLDCPFDWVCKAAIDTLPDVDKICVPDLGKRCEPCNSDLACASQGDRCLPLGTGLGEGLWCHQDCGATDECPDGYTCGDVKDKTTGVIKGRFCLPDNGSCLCKPEMDGTTRTCQRANQWGTCVGLEICEGNNGWVGCNAPLPAVESCDELDNDCDGDFDELYAFKMPDGSMIPMGQSCEIGECKNGKVICKNLSEATCSALEDMLVETCNGLDDDCDGVVDDAAILTFYEDSDGDGHGRADGQTTTGCEPPEGFSPLGDDCDDTNPEVAPTLAELCDGIDNNCDLVADEGLVLNLPNQSPIPLGDPCSIGICTNGTAVCFDKYMLTCNSMIMAEDEKCNDIDDDCDGDVDNGCDDDNDGWCDATMERIGKPSTCTLGGNDCDDEEKDVHPNRPEHCNGVDDNCDSLIDNEVIDCQSNSCQGTGGSYAEVGIASCEDGVCVSPDAIPCGYYTCEGTGGPGKHCLTSCLYDIQCVPGAHCEPDGKCVPDVPNTGSCDEHSDCVSNYCNNGFCCEAGVCCSGPADCPTSYWSPATCDYVPTCQGSRIDATCVAGSCVKGNPIPDDSACDSKFKSKDCGAWAPIYCNGKAEQYELLCPQTCFADSDCKAGFHCDVTCQMDEPEGSVCDEASDCMSGHCQNGHCCSDGDCCATSADCNTLVYGEPAVCYSPSTCQGHRKDPVCIAGKCFKSDPIDDDSGCLGQIAKTCDAFKDVMCNGAGNQIAGTCPTSCFNGTQCDLTAHCEGSVCVENAPLGQPCDTTGDCATGLTCIDGVCCSGPCDGLCKSCAVPGFEGTCTYIPYGEDPSEECGTLSCGNLYYGWIDNQCYKRADVAPSKNFCNGSGACLQSSQLCLTSGPGSIAGGCTGTCQTPRADTCAGVIPPECQPQEGGTTTCGVGACAVTVIGCINGVATECIPGNPNEEICNNIDDNCNGYVDDNVPGGEDNREPNNLCPYGNTLTTSTEGSAANSYAATLYPQGDIDYYVFEAKEESHFCLPLTGQTYSVTITLTLPQGEACQDFDLYLYDDACNTLKSSTFASCTNEQIVYSWSGTCASDDTRSFRIGVKPWNDAFNCVPYTLTTVMN